MASKTLVLSSNQGPLPEVYDKAALYFDPHDPAAITRVINQALNFSPQQRQNRLNRAFNYAQTFSWQITAQKTLKVYETCLSLRSSQ
jgi:glycosyltransferase involved in cell wall biosynthesis